MLLEYLFLLFNVRKQYDVTLSSCPAWACDYLCSTFKKDKNFIIPIAICSYNKALFGRRDHKPLLEKPKWGKERAVWVTGFEDLIELPPDANTYSHQTFTIELESRLTPGIEYGMEFLDCSFSTFVEHAILFDLMIFIEESKGSSYHYHDPGKVKANTKKKSSVA